MAFRVLRSIAFGRRTNPTRVEDVLWVLAAVAVIVFSLSTAVTNVQEGPALWGAASVVVSLLITAQALRACVVRRRHGYWELRPPR